MKKYMKNMKTPVGIMAFAALLFFNTFVSMAQVIENKNARDEVKNYAVLISQPNHVVAAVDTGETLTEESKFHRGEFVIMACGKSVEAFVKGSEFSEVIAKGIEAGIKYRICGMSLKQFKVAPESLMEGFEVVPNGLTYIFELKLNGYITLEL